MFAAATSYARNVFSAWTVQVTLYAAAAILALVGLLFCVVAGYVVLSRRFDPEIAALMIGGAFFVLAGIVLLVAKLRARRPAPGNELARIALASSAASMTMRTLSSVRAGRVGASLATGGIGLVGALLMLAGRALGIGGRSVTAAVADKAELSAGEAAGALASAVGRTARQAASDARSTWDDYQPGLRSRAASLQREVPRLVEAALPALAGMLQPEPRRWWALWRRRSATPLERLAHVFEGRERLAAAVAGTVALAVIASWMSSQNDS